MADVQCEHGFTKLANELLEVVMLQKFNGTQFKIIMAVWRFTYGFQRKEHDMSLTFLSNCTGVHKQQIKTELAKLIDRKIIIVTSESSFTSSRKLSFNKNYDEWKELQSVKKLTVSESTYTTVSENTTTTVSELTYQERNNKESIKESIYTVFEHWKTKGIIVHKKMNAKMQSHINARLQDYQIDELLKAIDNYAEVLTNDLYYWTYRWTLEDFMKPNNVVRFLDSSKPFEAFLSTKQNKKKNEVDWEGFNLD